MSGTNPARCVVGIEPPPPMCLITLLHISSSYSEYVDRCDGAGDYTHGKCPHIILDSRSHHPATLYTPCPLQLLDEPNPGTIAHVYSYLCTVGRY